MTTRPLATSVLALVAAALAIAGCGGGGSTDGATPATSSSERDGVRLTDLTSVEQLRTRFNDDRGTPRLILLLSPT